MRDIIEATLPRNPKYIKSDESDDIQPIKRVRKKINLYKQFFSLSNELVKTVTFVTFATDAHLRKENPIQHRPKRPRPHDVDAITITPY